MVTFDKSYHLERACGKLAGLRNIWVTGGVAYATDERMLACVPVDNPAVAFGWVSSAALKESRALAVRGVPCTVEVDTTITDRPPPDYATGIPRYDAGTERDEGRDIMTIALDPALLAKLASALGADELVTLTFPVVNGGENMLAPIRVGRLRDVGKLNVPVGMIAPGKAFR